MTTVTTLEEATKFKAAIRTKLYKLQYQLSRREITNIGFIVELDKIDTKANIEIDIQEDTYWILETVREMSSSLSSARHYVLSEIDKGRN